MALYIPWTDWKKPRIWRELAEEHTDSSGSTYVPIVHRSEEGGPSYELLRISRYSEEFDAERPAIRTSIRHFDLRPAELSRRTRDLGVARFITKKGKPVFVLESGADVFEWMAKREGVAESAFIEMARLGELARIVRRNDRKARKASLEEAEAQSQAYREVILRLERDLAQTKLERDAAQYAHQRMVENIRLRNEGEILTAPKSGSLASALGKAEERATILTSSQPLPGHYTG